MARKPAVPDEHKEQKDLFEWLQRVAIVDEPLIDLLVFAVPNGAKLGGDARLRSIQMRTLKEEGFVPGVADVLCLIPRQGYHFLAVEMKKRNRQNEKERGVITGGVSEGQREFLAAVKQAGGFDAVCYGADEAIELFKWYLDIKQDV